MQRRAAEESLTDHGKDNSNGRAHVGDAIRHKPGILGFLRQIGFMGATRFCDGHNAAVAFFGGVPRSILYDNTKLAVARILGDGKRQRTRVFTELQSHYLFEDRFGRPGKGNDKGKVEGLVGFIRRNFLVPVPRAESFAALNDALAEQCRRRQAARLRGMPPIYLIRGASRTPTGPPALVMAPSSL